MAASEASRFWLSRLSVTCRNHSFLYNNSIRITRRFNNSEAIDRREIDLPKAHPPFRRYYDNIEYTKANIKQRNSKGNADELVALMDRQKLIVDQAVKLRHERNLLKGKVAKARKLADQSLLDELMERGKDIKEQLKSIQSEETELSSQVLSCALHFPNDTHPDVPIGDEKNAKIVRECGTKQEKGKNWKEHFSYLIDNDLADFERGSQVTGNKFVFLKREAALLELALMNWAVGKVLSRSVTHGSSFIPISPPELVHSQFVSACGFNPRGAHSQVYNLESDSLCLIGTSEIPLAGLYANRLVPVADLPIRLVAFSNCFRAETGAGQQSKGLYRLHQFGKVEMFSICKPEDSEAMHEELLQIQEEIISDLGIPYRVLDMPTEELGASAYRKYDIEAWFPSRDDYGEICSASNCTDYQTRRLNLRYQIQQGNNNYAHSLNATALAVPRIIMAIIENFQREDGTIEIPTVLHPHMHGIHKIFPRSSRH